MQVGLIGPGKCGVDLALNFKSKNYEVIALDINSSGPDLLPKKGIRKVNSLQDLAETVHSKRIIWLMISDRDLIDKTLHDLKPLLTVGDIVIDGEDSNYKDTVRRAKELEALQIDYLDCGISGDIQDQLCVMIGGNRFAYNYCEPLFKDISFKDGYVHCGKSGAGHFVKMIHNCIRSGTQSIDEGFEVMQKCEYNLQLEDIAKVWKNCDGITARREA